MKKPTVLCILDGFGYNESTIGNAVAAADTKNIDMILTTCPHTLLGASGLDVGLPDGQMGNSEVGHTNIGAGRVVYQDLPRITKSIEDGDFFENEVLLNAINNCKQNQSALHLLGLVSDGGVHSHNTHLYALLELAKKQGLDKVYIHCIMDGRDVSPTSGVDFISNLYAKTKEIGVGQISTVMGRYYGMDRERKFDRVKLAYDAIANCEGPKFSCAREYIEQSYKSDVTDEFIIPGVSENAVGVNSNDSIIFFNFRPDRAREITRAFVDDEFTGFERNQIKPLFFVCMTQYDAVMPNVSVAFMPISLDMPVGAVISGRNMKQLRIAEYTKYAHVTFFLNGGEETVYPGEDRILIDSPNVPTYDLKPEMSAYEVCDKACEAILSGTYDAVFINFANCDMVGHTGVFDAAVKAVEAVDECVGRLRDAVKAMDGVLLITADHGNADKMIDDDGSVFTAHTINKVIFTVYNYPCELKSGGKLCDIAPTMLEIMNIEKPKQMTGESLIK